MGGWLAHATPLQYALWSPESQWQPRGGSTTNLTGRVTIHCLETLLAQAQYQGLCAAVPCLRLGLRGVERLLFCWERLAAAR